jgi:hypothetical protein
VLPHMGPACSTDVRVQGLIRSSPRALTLVSTYRHSRQKIAVSKRCACA